MATLAETILDIANSRKQERTMIICKVHKAPPDLHLKFSEEVIYPKQIYVSNYLLPHYNRSYTIDGVIDEININVKSYDFTNTTLDLSGDKIIPLAGSGEFQGSGTYKSHKDIWFEDTLKVGDEVLVAIVGAFYVVVSKITKMPSRAIEGE